MINRNVTAGQKSALLIGVPIHCVFDEVLPDTAVVESVALLPGAP